MTPDQPTPAWGQVSYELPDGTIAVLPPLTVGQVRRALLLDPDAGKKERGRENWLRMCLQVEVIFAPNHTHLLEILQLIEAAEVSRDLYRAAWEISDHGVLPIFAPYVYPSLGAAEDLGKLEALVIELSVVGGKSDAEIDAMPLTEARALSAAFDAPPGWRAERPGRREL